jgi:hypothetical protein
VRIVATAQPKGVAKLVCHQGLEIVLAGADAGRLFLNSDSVPDRLGRA